MSNTRMCPHPWLARPLCLRYEFAQFRNVRATVLNATSSARWRWGFGMVADGEFELLGAWSEPACSPVQIADDLAKRGVDRVKMICLENAYQGSELLADVAPVDLSRMQRDLRVDGFVQVAAIASQFVGRKRRALLSAVSVADRLHGRLVRAIGRRAPFACEEAAATFIAQWLEWGDRERGDPSSLLRRSSGQ